MHATDSSQRHVVRLGGMLARDDAPTGVQWTLGAGEDLHASLMTLGAFAAITSHVNDEVDVLLVVLDGDGWLSLDDTDHELAPGVVALAPKTKPRTITAGPKGLAYVTVHRRHDFLGTSPHPGP